MHSIIIRTDNELRTAELICFCRRAETSPEALPRGFIVFIMNSDILLDYPYICYPRTQKHTGTVSLVEIRIRVRPEPVHRSVGGAVAYPYLYIDRIGIAVADEPAVKLLA